MQCLNCHRKGHTARFYRAPAQPISQVPEIEVKHACYGCGEVGNLQEGLPDNEKLQSRWTDSNGHRRRSYSGVPSDQWYVFEIIITLKFDLYLYKIKTWGNI